MPGAKKSFCNSIYIKNSSYDLEVPGSAVAPGPGITGLLPENCKQNGKTVYEEKQALKFTIYKKKICT